MMKRILLILIPFLGIQIFQVEAQNSDFLMDERDGNIYLVARFNDQWWMCQDLKYNIGEGSGCYKDDETNCMLRGRLFNQEAARKACPAGYHLPSDNEWKALESFIGMDDEDLDKNFNRNSGTVGKFLRSGGGLSFDADYSGLINPKGNSSNEGAISYFWTSTVNEDGRGWVRVIEKTKDGVERQLYDKNHKLSVRCIRPATEEEMAVKEEKAEKLDTKDIKPEKLKPEERNAVDGPVQERKPENRNIENRNPGNRNPENRNPEDRKPQNRKPKPDKKKIPD